MGIFTKKEERRPAPSFHPILEKIKQETSLLTQWLHYFYKKNDEHDIRIRLLEQHAQRGNKREEGHKINQFEHYLAALTQQMKQMQKRIDVILAAQEPVLEKLDELEKRLTASGQQHTPLFESIKDIHQKLSLIEKKGKEVKENQQVLPNARERIAQKVAKKSKEYIKHTIQSIIARYDKRTGLQLREMVVDEQHLCSRSTFYRLLTELEEEGTIGSVREAKEKHYFSQLEKQIVQ